MYAGTGNGMHAFLHPYRAERQVDKAERNMAKQQASAARQRAANTDALHNAAKKCASKHKHSRNKKEAANTSIHSKRSSHTSKPIPRPPSAQPADNEESHDLALNHLMTLHLNASPPPSNALETLLATDEFAPQTDGTPLLHAIHEFIYGIQREQSELCQRTDMLASEMATIRDTVWKLSVTDMTTIARLEKMGALAEALCADLVLEEGAFRDEFEMRGGGYEGEVEGLFRRLRHRVGRLIRGYDGAVAELESKVGKGVNA
jgi:hypothetical protein